MRPFVTWLVLVAYVALAAGLPLPAGVVIDSPRHLAAAAKAGLLAAKDRSRPFPCMDSPCGCATAEQCFRECCCHSVAERIDWARRHGLEAELLALLESRIGTQDPEAPPKAGGDCCSRAAAKRKPSCCAEENADASRCHAGTVDEARPGREPLDAAPREGSRPRTVSLRALLACQGLVAEWLAVGGTLPPPVTETGTLPAPCGSIELVDAAAPSPPREPESPPPIVA